MPSTLIPACPLCGLLFPNRALLDLHVREDHLHRKRPGQPDHDDRGTEEMTTVTATRRPRPGPAVSTLRRAIGTLRYVNDELLRACEAIIRSARAPRHGPRPVAPAHEDARASAATRSTDRAA